MRLNLISHFVNWFRLVFAYGHGYHHSFQLRCFGNTVFFRDFVWFFPFVVGVVVENVTDSMPIHKLTERNIILLVECLQPKALSTHFLLFISYKFSSSSCHFSQLLYNGWNIPIRRHDFAYYTQKIKQNYYSTIRFEFSFMNICLCFVRSVVSIMQSNFFPPNVRRNEANVCNNVWPCVDSNGRKECNEKDL